MEVPAGRGGIAVDPVEIGVGWVAGVVLFDFTAQKLNLFAQKIGGEGVEIVKSQPSANASSVGYFRFSQAANFSKTGGLKVVLSVGSFQMFQLSSAGEERKRVTSSRIIRASGSRTSGRSSEG